MTRTLLSDFTGGAIGTNPTLATEPWASSLTGTAANAVYVAGLPGVSGQAIEVTNSRDFIRTVSGHWRLGMWVKRVSGTQSAGQAIFLARNGTTAVGDVFIRNQNGGQIALRAGSGGTTYAGQSTTTIANGDTWWVEYEVNGTACAVYLWHPGNNTNTPDETFTGTLTAAPTDVRIFNPTGVTGLTMQFAGLYTSDGEQIRNITAGTVKGRLLDVEGRVPTGTLKGRLFDVQATVPAAFIVSISDPGTLEPGIPVTVTATASGGTPSSYAWSCTNADFEPSGNTVVITPKPSWAGGTVTVTCTVSGSGAATGSGSRQIPVLPHLSWYAVGNAWVPIVGELLTL